MAETVSLTFCGSKGMEQGMFMGIYNEMIVPFIGYNLTLQIAIRLMVENIYEHAGGEGQIFLGKEKSLFTFFVQDSGPGYQGPARSKDFTEIVHFHKPTPENNWEGGSLWEIKRYLDRIKKEDPYATWEAHTEGRFIYYGFIASLLYERRPGQL